MQAATTVRLYNQSERSTSLYSYQDDNNTDKSLRDCIQAMDQTIPNNPCNYYRMMLFFARFQKAKYSDSTTTKVMNAVCFLVKHSNPNEADPLALRAFERIDAGAELKFKEKELLACAYYGLSQAHHNLNQDEVNIIFGKDVVKKLAGVEKVDAEEAKGLNKLAKRVKLVALLMNSDGYLKIGMNRQELSDCISQTHPIWDACLRGNEKVFAQIKDNFQQVKELMEKMTYEDKLNSVPPILPDTVSACEMHGENNKKVTHYFHCWMDMKVGAVIDYNGTILKVGRAAVNQGFFVEDGLDVCYFNPKGGSTGPQKGKLDNQSIIVPVYQMERGNMFSFGDLSLYLSARRNELDKRN
jgi:hypothetical protein